MLLQPFNALCAFVSISSSTKLVFLGDLHHFRVKKEEFVKLVSVVPTSDPRRQQEVLTSRNRLHANLPRAVGSDISEIP